MVTLNAPAYAVYCKNQKMFVYADMGNLKFDVIPRKSSCRSSLAAAQDLCDRYKFYLDKRIDDLTAELQQEQVRGPEYNMYRDRAYAKSQHASALKRLPIAIANAKSAKKDSDFIVAELTMKEV